MGVYIKNIVMPKACCDCFAERCIGSDFGCDILGFDDANTTCLTKKRRKDCPLIEVPPHGDLIDREALIKALHAWFDDNEVHAFEKDAYWHHGVVMKIINDALTIIPTEESEMDKRGCPPDYNGGFCADYDVDCKACWEQWEQEHKVGRARHEQISERLLG